MSVNPFFDPASEETEDPEAWKKKGSCRERDADGNRIYDPEIFFPTHTAEQYQREGKKVCRHCPVLSDCKTWALSHPEFGIWGGMSERDRRRRLRISPAEYKSRVHQGHRHREPRRAG